MISPWTSLDFLRPSASASLLLFPFSLFVKSMRRSNGPRTRKRQLMQSSVFCPDRGLYGVHQRINRTAIIWRKRMSAACAVEWFCIAKNAFILCIFILFYFVWQNFTFTELFIHLSFHTILFSHERMNFTVDILYFVINIQIVFLINKCL